MSHLKLVQSKNFDIDIEQVKESIYIVIEDKFDQEMTMTLEEWKELNTKINLALGEL